MRRIFVGALLLSVFMPVTAFAQTPAQPANKEAVLLQLLEDMKQSRAVIHPSEIEAAGCKVQVRQLQEQLEQMKTAAEKPAEKKAEEKKAD